MSIFRKPILLYTALFLVVMLPSPAFANLSMEYFTYGGFVPVSTALQKVALIFGDNSYKSLFFVAAVLGILVGGLTFYIKALSGGKASYGSWFFSVLTGVLIYLALIVPKGQLVVYDPVLNQTQTIGNIPDGVVLIAGTLNELESGLVNIVTTAGDPVGYQTSAGGSNFDILFNLSSKGVLLSDQYLNTSLQNYIQDCVFYELQRPGTSLSINTLASNSDFLSLFSQAASPSIYTTYYAQSNPSGAGVTCQSAWGSINSVITNPASFTNSINARCADAGYDPTIPSELTNCQSAITNTVNWLEGSSFAVTDVFRQFLVAQSISDAAASASPDTAMQMLATKNAASGMMGTAAMANQWLPIIRALLTAVAFCMIPLLALFVPTPIFGKALSTTVGFFLWITIWGVIDAILHQFAVDYASYVFTQIKQYQLGVTAVMNFSTAALKTLAAFATIRWAGLLLSTTLVGLLIKFGGSALAHLSGGLTGHVQGGGAQAGRQVLTPEGRSQTLGSLEQAPAVMANAHRWDYGTRAEARTFEGMSKLGRSISTQRELGPTVEQAADRSARSGMLSDVQNVSGAERFHGVKEAMDYAGRNKSQDIGKSGQSENIAEALYKGSRLENATNDQKMRALGEFNNGGRVTENELPALAKAMHMSPDDARGKLLGAKVEGKDLSVDQQTGDIMLNRFRWSNGNSSGEYNRGHIAEEGTWHTALDAMRVAHGEHGEKHGYYSKGLAGMFNEGFVNNEIGRLKKEGKTEEAKELAGYEKEFKGSFAKGGEGITDNEAIHYKSVTDTQGRLSELSTMHGTENKFYNTSDRKRMMSDTSKVATDHQNSTQLGNVWENKQVHHNLTDKQDRESFGHVREVADKDVVTSSRGTIIDSNTALQRVLNKDDSLVSGLTRAHTKEQKQAQIASIVSSLGNAISPFESRTGVSMDYSDAHAKMSAGVGTPGFSPIKASIDGAAGIGGQRTDTKQTNLVNQQLEQTLYRADQEAAQKGLKGNKADSYVMDQLYGHVHNMAEEHVKNNPDKFGASAGPTVIREKADEMLNKIKGE